MSPNLLMGQYLFPGLKLLEDTGHERALISYTANDYDSVLKRVQNIDLHMASKWDNDQVVLTYKAWSPKLNVSADIYITLTTS